MRSSRLSNLKRNGSAVRFLYKTLLRPVLSAPRRPSPPLPQALGRSLISLLESSEAPLPAAWEIGALPGAAASGTVHMKKLGLQHSDSAYGKSEKKSKLCLRQLLPRFAEITQGLPCVDDPTSSRGSIEDWSGVQYSMQRRSKWPFADPLPGTSEHRRSWGAPAKPNSCSPANNTCTP